MTQICCPACRLRFTRAAASGLEACPCCDEPLAVAPAEHVLGFRLWEPADRPVLLPELVTAITLAARRHPARP